METVSVCRTVAAPPDAVRDAMGDVGAFMRAADFTSVEVEGDLVHLENRVGLATMTLTLAVVDDPGTALAYEQAEGMFSEMETRYTVEPAGEGASEVTATTDFELGRGVVGAALDATLVARQRRSELTAQLEWLAERFGEPD